MRPCLIAAAILASLCACDAAAQARPEVDAAAKAVRDEVIAWRRDFHQFPELSNRKVNTLKKVADALRAMGLSPRTGIAKHGVTAVIKGGRPGSISAPGRCCS